MCLRWHWLSVNGAVLLRCEPAGVSLGVTGCQDDLQHRPCLSLLAAIVSLAWVWDAHASGYAWYYSKVKALFCDYKGRSKKIPCLFASLPLSKHVKMPKKNINRNV